MITYCFKFPDKETAHSLLYENGYSIYANMVDNCGQGLATARFNTDDGLEYLTVPIDGTYHVDIIINTLPEELIEFITKPTPKYRKHLFLGED